MKYGISKRIEKVTIWIAWSLPRSVAYWATIRVGVNATQGEYSHQVVPELTVADALKRWNAPRKKARRGTNRWMVSLFLIFLAFAALLKWAPNQHSKYFEGPFQLQSLPDPK